MYPIKRLYALLLAGCLAGCADLAKPQALMPASLDNLAGRTVPARPPAMQLDPAGERLVAEALQHSPDLEAIEARLRENAAQIDAGLSGLWPTLNADGSTGRALERSEPGTDTSDASGVKRRYGGLRFAWELDLFGQQASLRRSAMADRQAALLERDAARITLANTVRAELLRQRFAREELALARQQRELASAALTMSTPMRQAGLQTEAALNSLRSALAMQEADIASLQLAQTASTLRLRTLSNAAPALLDQAAAVPLVQCSAAAPLAVPLPWVSQRLDVAAAEHKLNAALAGMDMAAAARYPTFTLTGSANRTRDHSLGMGGLISTTTREFLGVDMAWNLFDGGRRSDEARAAQAKAQALAADFRRVVLQAAEETELAIGRVHSSAQAASLADQAYALARHNADLAAIRSRAGIDSRLSSLQQQRDALDRQRQQLGSFRDHCLAAIEMNRVLALSERQAER
ncbi:TolC family protein [Chitinimonas sp.]|uniref:TolC family protein n=1 Tax=Chitinimonas sp. TaxID=1934313 RepID=UPI0035AFF889